MKIRILALSLLAACLACPSLAQRHAQLTPAEIDQLRDAAMEPDQRLKLYIKFLQSRLAALEQLRTNAKLSPGDRALQIHDHLEDFISLYDELDDNIDSYVDRKDDVRKPLKSVIEADSDFQNRLRAFRDALLADKQETKTYEFVLTSAMEDVKSGANDHRQLLGELEEAAKHSRRRKQVQ